MLNYTNLDEIVINIFGEDNQILRVIRESITQNHEEISATL